MGTGTFVSLKTPSVLNLGLPTLNEHIDSVSNSVGVSPFPPKCVNASTQTLHEMDVLHQAANSGTVKLATCIPAVNVQPPTPGPSTLDVSVLPLTPALSTLNSMNVLPPSPPQPEGVNAVLPPSPSHIFRPPIRKTSSLSAVAVTI